LVRLSQPGTHQLKQLEAHVRTLLQEGNDVAPFEHDELAFGKGGCVRRAFLAVEERNLRQEARQPAFASQEIAQLLSKSLLFGALDDDARRELAGHAHRRSFDTGEPIFHVGAPGQSMVVILNGTVRVSLPGPRGKGVILADLRRIRDWPQVNLMRLIER
jgi:hypothetical protein